MMRRLARSFAANPGAATAFAVAALLAFAVALPAHAQNRLSLADRVARLEQQAQNQQGSVALVNQVQALQSQIQQLQGQIEELQHQVKQLQDSGKDQYVDLDSRLRRLEGSGAPAASATTPTPAASAPAVPATTPAPASVPAAASSSGASTDAAQAAYDTAFKALRSGDFVQSSRGFRDFIDRYPDNALAPNAYYWLGESYYITQNYPVALATFQKLIQLYPQSSKAGDALLKVGYSQYAMKQTDAATATLQSVVSKYPDTDVANLATRRLQDIQLQSAH